ncbi:MAG: IS66 family transposase [Polyangiaceae bacterium]|nr:IS66 family transposase [Polyangiaceae bacterium]
MGKMRGEPSTITSPHAPDLGAVKEWLEEAVRAMRLVELVAAVLALITRMRDLNTELTKKLGEMRRARPQSEKLRRVEQQLVLSFATVGAVKSDENDDAGAEKPERAKKSRRGRDPGRAALPDHLERVPEVKVVPPGMRTCPLCAETMLTVGRSCCEILEVRPAELYVRQRLDERVACRNCDTIVPAPTPAELVERGKLGTTLIIEALADKYLEHQPIERQCLPWSRTGVDIAPQTLGRSVAVAIDTLAPVAQMIATLTRAPGLLATDATGIPVLDRDAPDGIRHGTMWCWTNALWVTFFYSPQGDSDSVRRFLGDDLCRTVQCDGTNITTFLERAGGKRPGCWSHGRRGFAEAARGGDRIAMQGLRKIAPLFLIERESALNGETAAERLARRRAQSQPVVDDIAAWVAEQRAVIPPKTPLGAALGYLERQWRRLVLFLEDGNIELTNNRVERQLRKLVPGRRNWLFTWEDLGGERTAHVLTIVGSCVAYGVNPRAYLHLVTKLSVAGWPEAKRRDLLPDRLSLTHPGLLVRERGYAALPEPSGPHRLLAK